jgi:hypothetical protein
MVAIVRRPPTAQQLAIKAGDGVVWTRCDGTEEVRTVAIGPTACRILPLGQSLAGSTCLGNGGADRVVWLVGVCRPVRLEHVRPAWRVLFLASDHRTAGPRPAAEPAPQRAARRIFEFLASLLAVVVFSLGARLWRRAIGNHRSTRSSWKD